MKKQLLILLLVCISVYCHSEGKQPELQPALVGLYVKDIGESITWYKDTLGFELLSKDEYPDYGLKIAFLEREGFELELVENKSSVTRESLLGKGVNQTSIVGFMKLSFKVSDVNSFHKKIKSNNTKFFKKISVSNRNKLNKYFIVMDPDDNLIHFYGKDNS